MKMDTCDNTDITPEILAKAVFPYEVIEGNITPEILAKAVFPYEVIEGKRDEAFKRTPYKEFPLCTHDKLIYIGSGDCSKHPLYSKELQKNVKWYKCDKCDHVLTEKSLLE